MASVRIPVDRSSEFIRLCDEWKKSVTPSTMAGKMWTLPTTQGAAINGYIEYYHVDDRYLDVMRQQHFPFEEFGR